MWKSNANTILLVDNDPTLLLTLGRYFRTQGFNVLTAANGAEALRLIGEHGPGIVITDWEMPEMDGVTLCRNIRSVEGIPFVYVLLLTAHSDVEHIVAGFEAGANDYVAKPFSRRELLARVAAAQRIIQTEASWEERTIHSHKVNAEMGVINTALQRMARSLEESRNAADAANLAKTEFLANVSHEIRTPMTAILGFADMLFDPDVTDSEKLSAARTIRQNGYYLLSLIDDILDLSKIEAGRMTIEKVECSPRSIVSDVTSFLRMRADAKGLSFTVEYPEPAEIPHTIHTDPARLRQILVNLIGNAIKFTETGGVRLIVRLVKTAQAPSSREGEATNIDSDLRPPHPGHLTPMLQFDIVDTGIGMAEDQFSHLFQPFTQADSSMTRKFSGSGLGLAISRRLAGMLGGGITATSKLGQGSTIRLTIALGAVGGSLPDNLDAEQHTPLLAPPPGIAENADPVLSNCRILLAEDAQDNQVLLTSVLRKAGADVTLVDNGRLAVDCALDQERQGSPFDLILMDMQMPVMDGYEATKQIRAGGYQGPVIALTAHTAADDRDHCLVAGCNHYATKPIDRYTLVSTLQQHLESRALGAPA